MSESASGEATSSSDAADKEFSCPSCASVHDTERGMKIHHNRVHGVSISGREVECETCGKSYQKDAYEAKKYDEDYCSAECQSERLSDRYKGEGNPNHVENVERPCSYCGETISRTPAFMKSDLVFCDMENCKAGYWSENFSGENALNYKGGDVSCSWCGDDLDRDMNQIERSDHFFCGDKDCKAKWQSKHVRGDDHPRWAGGYDGYYGPNWPEERLAALINDQSRCQVCGDTPLDTESTLVVHHIQPMRVFKERYEGQEVFDRANRLNNLMVLCRSCHMTWEGIPLKPQ